MDTVKEARHKEGPEKAAWKRGSYQLDPDPGFWSGWCVPTKPQVGTCGQPQALTLLWVHIFFERVKVNSLLRLGWLATSPAPGLGSVTPHLAFSRGFWDQTCPHACPAHTSLQN